MVLQYDCTQKRIRKTLISWVKRGWNMTRRCLVREQTRLRLVCLCNLTRLCLVREHTRLCLVCLCNLTRLCLVREQMLRFASDQYMTTRANAGALSVRESSCERPVRDLEYHLRIMTVFICHYSIEQEAPVAPSSRPCSRCRSWEENPSWNRCKNACVNAQGIATLRDGREIRCSKSWDNNWWFFYCNRCKNVRPPLIGVLRGVKIERYNEQFGTYVTDSENSSNSCSEFDGTM